MVELSWQALTILELFMKEVYISTLTEMGK